MGARAAASTVDRMLVRSKVPSAFIAALGLVIGYLVADLTGVRAVGGVVLFGALALCARQWHLRVGKRSSALLIGIYLVLFVASHLLAPAIGAWPAVFSVAAVMFGAATLLADRVDADPRVDPNAADGVPIRAD